MSTVTVPFMPIAQFDETAVEQLKEDENNDEYDLLELCNSLPSNNSHEGRDRFTKEVAFLLHAWQMTKYMPFFMQEDINMETFCDLTTQDLIQLGITDEGDRNSILGKLQTLRSLAFTEDDQDFVVPYDIHDDSIMVRNILNHLVLLRSYISFINLQLKKDIFMDYHVSKDHTAAEILKLLVKRINTQCSNITRILYTEGDSDDNIINLIKSVDNLVLPPLIEKKLEIYKPEPKKRLGHKVLKIITAVTVTSAIFFFVKRKYL